MSAPARTVFTLWHSYETEGGAEEVKLCGIYSERAFAEAARERLIDKPGFKDRPEGFLIEECELDQDGWIDGFISWDEAN